MLLAVPQLTIGGQTSEGGTYRSDCNKVVGENGSAVAGAGMALTSAGAKLFAEMGPAKTGPAKTEPAEMGSAEMEPVVTGPVAEGGVGTMPVHTGGPSGFGDSSDEEAS